MKKKRQLLPLLGLLCLCTTAGFAQPIPLDTAVRYGKLPNGFTYYIRYNNEPKNRVIFYLANKIGSMQEDDDQQGLAHFMEHMNFNGTKHYPKNQLIDYLQRAGVRFGADLNAYTSFNETVYQLPLPSDDTAVLRNGLQIMRDWANGALLETGEIDKERGVVIEEMRLHSGLAKRLQDKLFPVQVSHSRYACRLPIGTEQVLNNFSPATVSRFYKDWYRPNLQALIVVGDIDVRTMEARIKKLFGDLKNPGKERPLVKYDIPLTGKNQFLSITDHEQRTIQINLIFKQREQPLKTKADMRIHLVRNLLNAALGGRLSELKTRPEPAFIGASAGLGGFMGGLDAFSVDIVPRPGQIKAAFDTVWTQIVRLQQQGITQTEFDRVKLAYISALENNYKEKNKRSTASFVQQYLAHYLQGVAAPGPDMDFAMQKELLTNISLEEVNALARTIVKEKDRDLMITAPETEKADLPTEAQLNAWIETIKGQKLTPWKDEGAGGHLMPTLPVPGKVMKRERMDSVGVTIYTLNNGVRIWVKTTNFKNEEILFNAISEGGTSLYPDSLFLQASAAVRLIAANGLDTFNPVALKKMLTGKAVSVSPYLQELFEGISGATTPKDLETALQLTHLYFTKPRYDSTLFKTNIGNSKAMMANRTNSPGVVFGDTVKLIMNGYHYRSQPSSVAKLDSISLDKAFAIYKERFANAADFVFVFTGNIDTATFLPLIERYLGSLPATAQRESFKDIGVKVPAGRVSKTVYKGKDSLAVVKLYYHGDFDYNDANAIHLGALRTVLQYRITERLREREGGAYSPQTGVSYERFPQSRYLLSIDFACAPQNADKLIEAANDEINKMKTTGILEDDINKFRAEKVKSRETKLQTNTFWQQYFLISLQYKVSPNDIFNVREEVNTVTPQSLQQAAQQFFNDKNYIRLVLMPEP